MKDKIELLEVKLLEDRNKLKDIDHWLSVMNWPNGWHYDLDIIWVLQHIEELNLPKGATIIDAGAGLGMTQFILAARGYNVLSLDFTKRKIPRFAQGIFKIDVINTEMGDYKHEYMSFMTHGQSEVKATTAVKRGIFLKIKKAFKPKLLMRHITFNIYRMSIALHKTFNLFYLIEKNKDHSGFGKITFLRGTFNKIPMEDKTADALVSISAFEHNTYEDMPGSIKDFLRVLKTGAPMLITTSVSDRADWFFEPPKAWIFSKNTLSTWFNIASADVNFDYARVFANVINSAILKKRISPYYKINDTNGLPYGNLKEAKFVPVGIVKIRQ